MVADKQTLPVVEDAKMESMSQLKCSDDSEYLGSGNGEIWAADISGKRESQARALIDLIVVQEKPCTICLNAGWGSGKTFFLTRFVKEYSKEIDEGASGSPTAIYFNAWKDDFVKDPLFSVLGQIVQADGLQRFKDILTEVKSVAKPLLAQMGLELVKCLIKGLAQKTLGLDVEKVKDSFNLSLGDIDALTEKDLQSSYKELCESRDLLRGKLGELARANWNISHRPLVIVVDELDRCRPIFAIELLERIKHLFDVPHLVFIIGMNAEELRKSLKSVYGDINAQDYLLRFIDVETMLPPLAKDDFVTTLWHRLGYDNLRLAGISGIVYEKDDLILRNVKLLARVGNLTLRQIEQCIRLFVFLARPYKTTAFDVSPEMIATAIVLKVINAELYERFLKWDFKVWELVNCIVPANLADYQRDFVDVKEFIGELYKLACSVRPMGVLRQNLSWFAEYGKPMPDSHKEDFGLPLLIENLPPQQWQVVCQEYAGRMGEAGKVNHEYLKQLSKIQERTMSVLKETFMLLGNA